ncbi:MAG: hypothetical protein CL608_23315 [Anaerolineaceae bacterium]|nr:hypothetical protein [Anaerolineaceae bacterium]
MTTHSEIANPFVGPRPFERKDALLFKGRQQEARDLLTLFLARRLVLLYAPSGAGKTSLLKAKLMPDLEQEEQFEVLPVGRVGDSITPPNDFCGNRFVFNLLVSLGICEKPELIAAKETSLNHFLLNVGYDGNDFVYFDETEEEAEPEAAVQEGLAEDEEVPVQPRALIIDQFEEMFTMHPELEADRIDFFKQVGEAMVNDPYLYVMISMRGDYLYRIIPYVHLLPNSLRARFQLQRLQAAGALQAVCEPAAEAGRPFNADVAEKLVECLRRVRVADGAEDGERPLGDYVEAMQLQVVCQQLWYRLAERPGETISMADVDWVVGQRTTNKAEQADSLDRFVDNALADYYEEALRRVLTHLQQKGINHVDEYALRRWFSTELITEAGTRDLVARMGKETKGMPETAVAYLDTELYLIRNEIRAGNNFIELVHDSFVEPIRTANRKWQEELERRIPWLNNARRYARNPNPSLLLDDYNSLQAARKRVADEAEKGGLPPTTLQFLESYLEKGEEAYQRQLIQDVPWLNSARQYAENQNPDLLFGGNTLQLAIQQAAKAKANGSLPNYADDFLQASIEKERKGEIKKLRQEEEARRREELTQQELVHERSLAEEQKKRAGIALGFGTLAVVLAIAASFFGVSARNNAAIAENRKATAIVAVETSGAAEATSAAVAGTAVVNATSAAIEKENALNAEATAKADRIIAEQQLHLADSLRLVGQARDYLSNGQGTSALLLSIEASQSLIRARDAAPDNASLTSAQYEVQGIMLEALFNFDGDGNFNPNLNGRYFRDVVTTPYETVPKIFPGPEPGTVATIQDGAVIYWSLTDTMTETLALPDATEPISQTTISQNGTRLALLQNKTIEVYSVADGVVQEQVTSFDLDDGFRLNTMMFNSDGTRLAVAACPELARDEGERNNTQSNSDESGCALMVYPLPGAGQSVPAIANTCRLGLPTVTAVAFLEQVNFLVLSGTRGLEPAPTQLLYLLDMSTETCRQEAVSVSSDHIIKTIAILPEMAGQPGFIVTAGRNLQWWRFDEEQAQLQPFGPLLSSANPIKDSFALADQQVYVALNEANNIIAYNTNMSQWPEIGCGLANRNLTYTEWGNAFPLDELEDYHQTCAVYSYEAFGVHISLARYQLQQAQNELQQCNLSDAQVNFNSALDFAGQSSYENYIAKTFPLWAVRELLNRDILSTTACTVGAFEETLQHLVDDNTLIEDLKIIAANIRLGKGLIADGDFEEGLARYESVLMQIADLPDDYQDIFDRQLVSDYSSLCINQLIPNYEEACNLLTEFARPAQAGESYLADTEEIQLWEFAAAEGDFVSIVMKVFDSSLNSLDPYVTLLDSNANQVAAEDDYRSGQYSKITVYRIPEDGFYYVRTMGYAGETSGAYELMVSRLNEPTEIVPGVSQTASAEEVQLWYFEGQAGDFFDISLSSVENLFESQLILLDSQGLRLNSAGSDSSNTATLSSIPIFEDGTYYLYATGLGNATGLYGLEIAQSVPGMISFGIPQTADIADVQMWQFSGDAGQIFSIEMTAVDDTITPYFELLDSEGAYLTSSQSSADGRSATLPTIFMPYSGEYYLRASELSGQTAGIYDLVITELGAQEIDAIALDTNTPGSLEGIGLWLLKLQEDVDTAQPVRIQMAFIDQTSFLPYLTILDEAGREISALIQTDDGFSASEAIYLIDPNITYIIRVNGNNDGLEGEYTIRASVIDVPPIEIDGETEVGNTLEQPLWSFMGNEGETITIAMNERVDDELDTVLLLYDAAGIVIAENDDSIDGSLNSLIEITLPETGLYFINTQGYGGASGTYELTVRRVGT